MAFSSVSLLREYKHTRLSKVHVSGLVSVAGAAAGAAAAAAAATPTSLPARSGERETPRLSGDLSDSAELPVSRLWLVPPSPVSHYPSPQLYPSDPAPACTPLRSPCRRSPTSPPRIRSFCFCFSPSPSSNIKCLRAIKSLRHIACLGLPFGPHPGSTA